MKRTTYILIGLIVSGLIVIIASIIFISTTGKPYKENGIFIGGDQVEMNMDGIHVVKMLVAQSEDNKGKSIYMNGDVKVASSSAGEERKIVYPKNEYLKVSRMNDTLLVEFDFNERNIMGKTFVCSLCRNGIIGGGLYIDEQSITYSTQKLTVSPLYRNLVLPMNEIRELSWSQMVVPVAAISMKDGECYKFIIYNKSGFEKAYKQYSNHQE